jgi:hypothetical protein
VGGLEVDKQDLKRYGDFINREIYDLLLRGQAIAKTSGRNIIEPFDLPITKGLQESIHTFRKVNEDIELASVLGHLTARPPLDIAYSDDLHEKIEDPKTPLPVLTLRVFEIAVDNIERLCERHAQSTRNLGQRTFGFEFTERRSLPPSRWRR